MPLEYFRIGHVALGNPDGFLPNIRVAHPLQLHYPLADGMTRLAYDLASGVSVVVDELLAVAVPPSLQPWDRNPSPLQLNWGSYMNGNTATTVLGTLTVPAGRNLLLQSLYVDIARTAQASSVNFSALIVYNGAGGIMSYVIDWQNVVGAHVSSTPLGDGVLFLPGQTFGAQMNSYDTGGTHYCRVDVAGVYFDS